MVLFDNNVLCLLLHPDADIPNDPATGQPVAQARDRLEHLVQQLQEQGRRIVIPTPVIMEFLTFASPEYLTEISRSMWFEVASFDQRAAIEAAVALRRALAPGGKGKTLGMPGAKWQKIKVDRQIIAIGKVHRVTAVYSTDKEVLALAEESGLKGIHVADLLLPPVDQVQMTLEELLASTTDVSSGSEQPAVKFPMPDPAQDLPAVAKPQEPGLPPLDAHPSHPKK